MHARSAVGRRRLLRRALLVLLALGVVAVVVAYRLRPRHTLAPLTAISPLPSNAQQAAAGYSLTHSEGQHEVFTVRAQRSTDLKNGQGTILDGVLVEVFGRTGNQHDLVKANRCEYNSTREDFSCTGPVAIELDAPRAAQTVPAPDYAPSSATLHGRHPVYLNTSGLVYNQKSGLLNGRADVDWRYGPATGSAVGLTYATRDGSLDLDHNVTATVPVQAPVNARSARVPSLVQISAAHLRYAKSDGQVELTGPVRVTEGDRRMDAGHAVLYLDTRNRLTRALLGDGVQAADRSESASRTLQASALAASFDPATGDLKDLHASGQVHLQSQIKAGGFSAMAADQVRVSFTGAHFHPVKGDASGNVHLTSESGSRRVALQAGGTAPTPARHGLSRENLEAANLQFSFRPADGTLDEAHTIGPGKLDLVSADPRTGNRIITAGRFQMAFDARSRLKNLQGLGPTRVLYEPAATARRGTVAMESSGDSLQASLDPLPGALQSVRQVGHFEFIDGDRHATADRADYSSEGDYLTLTGNPLMSDPADRLRADHVVMHLATNTAEGVGHVSSTHVGEFPAEGLAGAGQAPSASSASGIASGVTNVLADRVMADRSRQVFRYEGHVRAWRGTDVIQAPAVDIYRLERRLVADSGVITSDLEPSQAQNGPSGRRDHGGITRQVAAGPTAGMSTVRPEEKASSPLFSREEPRGRGSGATQPVTIRADRLEYRDLEHKAMYRGHVRMDASGATLECDRLDAYFTTPQPAQPSQLDRAVADGNVVLLEPGRRGTGDHADYLAREGKIVMTGGPPSLYDAQKGFTTGRSLTFFTQDDSLLVDGGAGFRSLSEHRLTQ
ncbi:MAG TPA: LptA/OstA family protein [Terriglobia bacterium]|nr:LptA/OstA family protein [Terriglobia bacterium]